MNRCVILCGYIQGNIRQAVSIQSNDYVICADAGLDLALKEGICPHLYIGDGDSGQCVFDGPAIRLPVRKDDTDLMACVKYAIEQGYRDLVIVGGLGGRFDHSIASVQTLAYALDHGAFARILDQDTEILLCRDRITLPRRDGFTLSVFAFGGDCTGVSLVGTAYPLENASLTPAFPLGVSNEIIADKAIISTKTGTLLVIRSRNR